MSNEEPSVIAYARFYGLTQDHLALDPLQGLKTLPKAQLQLEDGPDLFQLREDCVELPRERLDVSPGALSLLSEVLALAKCSPSFDSLDEIDTHRVRRLKLELPLLRTDPEVDLIRFAPQVVPDLEHEFLPLETIDEEADEGLTLPSSYERLPEEWNRRVQSERLEVNGDALFFLQDTLKWHHEGEDPATFKDVDYPYEKKKMERLSSPMLPMSPEILPHVPSSETGRLDLLSNHSSPLKEEQAKIERRIFAEDTITPVVRQAGMESEISDEMLLDVEGLGEIYSPLRGIADPPPTPDILRRSLGNRKVEEPMSPPRSELRPPWKKKTVSWTEDLAEVIHDLPLEIPRPENTSSDDIDAFFEEIVRPIGIKGERKVEQEQLEEADTTMRVSVPIMDFSLPVSTWQAEAKAQKLGNNDPPYKRLLREMKKIHLSNHFWPMSATVERELKWTPFPAALGKVELQESITDDSSIEEYLAQPNRVDVYTLAWKPDGLRIFDGLAESLQEVLEEGIFPEECDIRSLIAKRKFELQEDDEDPGQSKRKNTIFESLTGREETNSYNARDSPLAKFSTAAALDRYVTVKKGANQLLKLRSSQETSNAASPNLTLNTTIQIPERRPAEAVLAPFIRPHAREVTKLAPAYTVPIIPTPFIVSSTFLNERKLARQVQRLFPSAEFFERDFNLHLGPFQERPSLQGNFMKGTISIIEEVDILLSPSTGLIWTTMQRIKQRPLPGQTARSGIRKRIVGTASRYEQLIILIEEIDNAGDGNTTETDAELSMDISDCEAFVELTIFCNALNHDIQLNLVAPGNDSVADWMVAMMAKHGVTDPNLKIIQDETLWELFLRRVGFNAFAAQVVIESFKASERDNLQTTRDCGLAVFVTMSAEQRCRRFETLLGGRRLLQRVNIVLDGGW